MNGRYLLRASVEALQSDLGRRYIAEAIVRERDRLLSKHNPQQK
jgi:hypothetical protein